MNLHLDMVFRSAPHFGGEVPHVRPIEANAPLIKKAIEAAIDDAIEAGLFHASGCLIVTIQASRKL